MTKTIAVKIGVVVGSNGKVAVELIDKRGYCDWEWMMKLTQRRRGDHCEIPATSRSVVVVDLPIPDVPTIPEIQGKAEAVPDDAMEEIQRLGQEIEAAEAPPPAQEGGE